MRSTSRPTNPCIVLPTDFQQPAWRAFTYALRLAPVLECHLQIIHVIKTVSKSSQVSPDSRYLNSLKTSALLKLGHMARTATEAGIHAKPTLLFGTPSDCILEFASRFNAELIVMGTHGRSAWDRMKLGSTAQMVVRGAPCPVLTLQEVVARDSFRYPAKVSLGQILVATDFSSCARAALHYAAKLATHCKAKMCVVHAADEGLAKQPAQRKLAAITRELRRKGLEIETRSVSGDPVEVILSQAAEWQADMIAIGTNGRRGLSRLLLGSVAETVLARSGSPILVVRKDAR